MIYLNAQYKPIPQNEPKEGRFGFPINQNNVPITFATGNEEWSFNSNSMVVGGVRPSGILSIWVDASALTTGKHVSINNGLITLLINGGDQAYALLPTTMPADIVVASPDGGTGVVKIVLFNFNINAMGTYVTAQTAPVSSGSGGSTGGYTGGIDGGPSGGAPVKTSF